MQQHLKTEMLQYITYSILGLDLELKSVCMILAVKHIGTPFIVGIFV